MRIDGARDAVGAALAPLMAGTSPDITEENIQSRLRGVMLMALSNKFGELLLTTGNKSEVAVGYATIYGDMAGGYNPIKDLYKTRVFRTCRWRNENHRPWMLGPAAEVIQPPFKTREATATRTATTGGPSAGPTDAQRGADGDHPAARTDAPGD